MSLHGAFEIGRSALLTSQLAMRIAGNNMANAVTPGFSRRTIHLSALQGWGGVGQGVGFSAARREIDLALQARFRDAISRETSASIDQRFLGAIEALQNELGDTDMSSALNEFFNAFSNLANTPSDTSLRTLVVEHGVALSGAINDLRDQYQDLGNEIATSIDSTVEQVNSLLTRIAELNEQIVAEDGTDDSVLMDERDLLLTELSQYMDVAVIQQESGMTDVLVGSVPLVLGTEARGIEARFENGPHGLAEASIRVQADGTSIQVTSGSLGGLLRQRADTVIPAIETLETFARELIWQVNRLHSQGQGLAGFTSVTSGIALEDIDTPLNQLLDYPIANGSFSMHLRDPDTGEIVDSWTIDVDGSTMSLDDLRQAIGWETAGEIDVTITSDGRLQLEPTSAGREITFSEDSAGVLAALEINTFFTGSSAGDIAVGDLVRGDSSFVVAAGGNVEGSADMALAIAGLRDTVVDALGGQSLTAYWSSAVGSLAVQTNAAAGSYGAASLVRNGLSAQVQSVSGVSVDEESINLLTYERQYQAAARYIEVLDETIQTLLAMV
ncbi:MAG: flagellar hook-associated protein FlgK [Phycisphaerales bacterium]|nr:flagellar hook-associated protein FlgK [Phycisphaerales bacterium]